MNISITDEAAQRLEALLQDEGKDAVVRIREVKIGPPWKSQFVLRLSIDEKEKDDMEASVRALPFVIGEDLAEQYGDTFAVTLDEHQVPTVAVL